MIGQQTLLIMGPSNFRSAQLKWCQSPTFHLHNSAAQFRGNCGPRFSRYCHHRCWGRGASGFFVSVSMHGSSLDPFFWCHDAPLIGRAALVYVAPLFGHVTCPRIQQKESKRKPHLPILRCHVRWCRMSPHRLVVLPAEVASRIQGGEVPVQHWQCAGKTQKLCVGRCDVFRKR